MNKNLFAGLVSFALLISCTSTKNSTADAGPNSLTAKEGQDGWQLLFDGKTTTGWHTYNRDTVSSNWSVADGLLMMNPAAKGAANRGDLVTNSEYENYELSVEWRISEAGNSGIIFNVQEDPKYNNTYITGPEMQILDNIKAADNKKENHLAGLLYDMSGTAALSQPKAVGEWNNAVIMQNKGRLQFHLNGMKTLDVQQGSEEWKAMVAGSKFKTWQNFALTPKGKIAFQDHGNEVAFRNIKIRML